MCAKFCVHVQVVGIKLSICYRIIMVPFFFPLLCYFSGVGPGAHFCRLSAQATSAVGLVVVGKVPSAMQIYRWSGFA